MPSTIEALIAEDQSALERVRLEARIAFARLALTLADTGAEDPPEAEIREVVAAHLVRDLAPVDPQRPAADRAEVLRQATLDDLRVAVDRAKKRRGLSQRARSVESLSLEMSAAKDAKRAAQERLEAVKKQLEEQLKAADTRLRGLSAALGDAKDAKTELGFMGPGWAVTELEIQTGFLERKALVSRRDQAAFLVRSLERITSRLDRQIRHGEEELSLPRPKRAEAGGIGLVGRFMPWHKGSTDEQREAVLVANKRLQGLREDLDEKRAALRRAQGELAEAEAALAVFDQAQEGSPS